MTDKPLSPRHERFVAEVLKDGNATRAYVRAGYSPRGAQPSASRLLRDPRIEAAIAAGRQHLAQALAVSVERIAQEYAKIAFANVADYVSVEADGRLRIDLEKASQAQQAGIIELRVSNHSKQEQRVILKLGKLQALAALAKQLGGLAAKPEPVSAIDGIAADLRNGRLRHEAEERARLAERQLAEARAALALAEARPRVSSLENPNPSIFPIQRWRDDPDEPPGEAALVEDEAGAPAAAPPPETSEEPRARPTVMPGMPTQPSFRSPGLYPDDRIVWTSRDRSTHPPDPDHDPYRMNCEYDLYREFRDDD